MDRKKPKEAREPRKPFPWSGTIGVLILLFVAALIATIVYGWIRNNNEILAGYTIDVTSTQVVAVQAVSAEWSQILTFALHASWVGVILFTVVASLNGKNEAVMIASILAAMAFFVIFAMLIVNHVMKTYHDIPHDMAVAGDFIYEKGENEYTMHRTVPVADTSEVFVIRAFKDSPLNSGEYKFSVDGTTFTLKAIKE